MTGYTIRQLNGANPYLYLVTVGILATAGPHATVHWEETTPVLTIPDSAWANTHATVGRYLQDAAAAWTNPVRPGHPLHNAIELSEAPPVGVWRTYQLAAWSETPNPVSWSRLCDGSVRNPDPKTGWKRPRNHLYHQGGRTTPRALLGKLDVARHRDDLADDIDRALAGGIPRYEPATSVFRATPASENVKRRTGSDLSDIVRTWEMFGIIGRLAHLPAATEKTFSWCLWPAPLNIHAVHALSTVEIPVPHRYTATIRPEDPTQPYFTGLSAARKVPAS